MTEAAKQLSETNKWLPCSRSKRVRAPGGKARETE